MLLLAAGQQSLQGLAAAAAQLAVVAVLLVVCSMMINLWHR